MLNVKERRNPILPLLFLLTPIGSAASAILDGAMKVRDSQGYWVWSTTSNYSSLLITSFGFLIIAFSLGVIVRDLLGEKRILAMPYVVIAAPVAMIACHLIRSDYTAMVNTGGVAVILTATAVLGIKRHDIRLLANLAVGVGLGTIFFAIVNPIRAIIPCREDKCTVLNGLLTSFFPQENVLAIFMIFSVVLVMFGLRGTYRLLAGALLITLVSLSGSRTVTLAAIVIASLSLAIIYTRNAMTRKFIWIAAGILTLASFAASAVLFFAPLDQLAFTGRGFIYELLRSFWFEQPAIGPGRGVLEYAHSIGISANYAIAHEHGGIPYMLVNGGILVTLFFAYWLFRLIHTFMNSMSLWPSGLSLALTVAVAIVSITEPVWTYDFKSPAFWTLALVSCSLFPYPLGAADIRPHKTLEVRQS